MVTPIIWHGTPTESAALINAIARNCTCSYGLMGMRVSTCPPHEMMVSDQRAMDGLVWEYRLRACRLREEGIEAP